MSDISSSELPSSNPPSSNLPSSGVSSPAQNFGSDRSAGDAAKDVGRQARQAGAAAADQARDLASEVKMRASSVAGAVKDEAASLAGAIQEQAKSLGQAHKDKAADALEDAAKAIHKSGEQLEGHQDWAARLVERGAAELEALAASLRRNDVQGLLDNLSGLARRQPAVFVGASMAAGFLLTRVGRIAAESAPSPQGSEPPTSVPIYASEARHGQP
jgi:hypothetical protein